MGSMPKFSYQRLRHNEAWFDEGEEEERAVVYNKKARKWKWSRPGPGLRRFGVGNRARLRIPGLRRFLRKRSRFLSRVRVSWRKALKKLKNGQAHMNDLLGGNFLVLQLSHSPFRNGNGNGNIVKPSLHGHG